MAAPDRGTGRSRLGHGARRRRHRPDAVQRLVATRLRACLRLRRPPRPVAPPAARRPAAAPPANRSVRRHRRARLRLPAQPTPRPDVGRLGSRPPQLGFLLHRRRQPCRAQPLRRLLGQHTRPGPPSPAQTRLSLRPLPAANIRQFLALSVSCLSGTSGPTSMITGNSLGDSS